jgi:hypothetical protein
MSYEVIDERDPFSLLAASEDAPGDCHRGTLCVEAIVAIGEFASSSPNKWRTFRVSLEKPGATLTQIAGELGIGVATAHGHLSAARRELNLLSTGKPGKGKKS